MTYENVLNALSDPTRRRVFEALAAHPASVSEIARTMPVSRPAVSQHLKVLSEAGLVSVRAEGTRRIYAARPEGLAELRIWLNQYWDEVLTSFAAEIDNEAREN